MNKLFPLLLLFIVLLNACTENEESTFDWSAIPSDSLQNLTPVITFEEHQIANPRDIHILSNGNLLILDYNSNKYHILSPEFKTLHIFGGEGEGPGEFLSPGEPTEIEGNIFITDNNTTRISRFSLEGDFRDSFMYESSAIGRNAAGIGPGTYVANTDGTEGYLLKYSDLRNNRTFGFGSAPGGSYSIPDIEKGARQVRAGEIPDFMKNNIKLMADEEFIYVYRLALSEQLVYQHDGTLADSFKVNLPYLDELFEMYRGQADPSPSDMDFPLLPVIDYIWDVDINADSYWYLTKAGLNIPTQIVRYDKKGNPTRVFELPDEQEYKGIVRIEADEVNDKLYLVNYNAVVFEADISQ